MNYPRPHARRARAAAMPARFAYKVQFFGTRRQTPALIGGILVALITAWLIWAAFAEAAAALNEAARVRS